MSLSRTITTTKSQKLFSAPPLKLFSATSILVDWGPACGISNHHRIPLFIE